MSFAQERLWFLEQLEPETAVYNICRASRLVGNLNTSALEASLNEIVSRHETLRTALRLIDGRPLQVVQPTGRISIDFTDLRSVPDSERDADIQRRIKAETQCPFDLTTGFLLRCKLLRVSDEEHVLILMTHHSASDAWSMGLLTRELWTLYEAFSIGKPLSLDPLPVQYSDYAVWQRNWLQGEVLDTQLAYWKKQLGDLSMLNLPTDRPRTPRQSFSGARLSILLPEGLTRSVNELSHRYAVTPFMTLLAAFQVLLYRYTGQEDVVIGSPVANRRRPEIESLIGFFVNTLVLRAKLSGKPSFSELLLRVRDICVAAHANQDLPFEKLVQELQPERDLSRNPLFQVMFVLQNATSPFTDVPGLRVEPIEIETTRSPFDLSFFLRERNGKFIGYLEFSTDLFERATIERMAGHYQTLIEGIVADPDQPIATLPILTEAERHQILVEWNDTATDYPKDKCIHELFEAQVERTPEAIALEFEGEEITYRELNRRANQLAHYLISLGVGPEKLVGICVERSIEMVVGLLGILKTGGAYLPLDPAYPNERLRFMLEDAQVEGLLTQVKLVEDRGWGIEDSDSRFSIFDPRLQLFYLDRDSPMIEQESSENPKTQSNPHNLAYVIYTSGSTGQPMGVRIEHLSVVNCLSSIGRAIDLSKRDAWLAVTTISFDIAALELYLPLFTGAKIVLASTGTSSGRGQLLAWLEASQATIMQATPSLWKLLIESGWERNNNFKILCGGEALSRQLADQLLDHSGSVWNLYGPTESTIWSTIAKVEAGEKPVSIGRPIANTQIYILDAHLQTLPVGIPGDLYIGGDGLARGYLGRPELTAEKFAANLFNDNPNSRLYRTGDQAKYLADGNIEYVGRQDNQAKIRGHRVELGEVESILNRHSAVKESAIVAHDRDSSGEKELVGYVVSKQDSLISQTELRRFLQEKLPGYMVPSLFVFLETFPLTPNGKIDRNALPPPDGELPQLDRGFVEPRTEIEELIAQVWREVLKLDKIGIHDNFFDIGGHSLLAVSIISRLKDIVKKDVSVGEFFDVPTISDLAIRIERKVRSGQRVGLPPIVRVSRSKSYPLSLSQRQLWTLDQLLPGTYFLNMPYAYRLTGVLNIGALEMSLQEIVRRHEAFRMVFSERRGRPVQSIGKVPKIQLPITDLRGLPEENRTTELARLSTDDASLPFDLEEGPPIRAELIRLADLENILLVTVHHIVCDDWSMQVFRRELTTLYDSFCQAKSSPLPDPRIHFIDFLCWQKDILRRGLLKAQLAYWKQQLGCRPKNLALQENGQQENESGFSTATESFEIESTLLPRIRALANKENCTTFMVFLTVLKLVFHVHTGKTDVTIGTTVANRNRPETENVIGNFLNAVVLRTEIQIDSTFSQLLIRVRQICLEAFVNQDVPFGNVAKSIRREGPTFRNEPLNQVMFIYQKRTFESVTCSGITFAPLGVNHRRPDQDVLVSGLDVIFELREALTKLTGNVTYKTHGMGQAAASAIVAKFKKIMRIVIWRPDECIENVLRECVDDAIETS